MRYDNLNCLLALPLNNHMSKSLFKVIPKKDYKLDPNRIDIWQFPLIGLPDTASSLLNEAEQARANRFYFPRHQRRFTIARAMLRLILGAYLGESPLSIMFSYNHHGKPKLSSAHGIEFNLSHSQDLALLAVGQYHPLGIDVEFFSARPWLGIAKDLFSKTEYSVLSQLPAYIQPAAFFNIWSQKEAFIKACGLGLSYPTQQFDVPVLATEPMVVADNLHQLSWRLISFMPEIACSAALCCHPDVTEWRYQLLDDAWMQSHFLNASASL